MNKQLLILTFLIVSVLDAVGQERADSGATCGFGQLLQLRRRQDPQFDQRFRQAEKILQQQINRSKGARMGQETVYTLPIVVHVIHNGEAVGTTNNPSDASIQAMIAQLNMSWRKNGLQYGGADIGIQFQLAVRSPQCSATTGINRVNGSGVANYTTGGIAIDTYTGSADESAIKNLSRWPNTDYINIWVVNKIDGNSNIAGFAWFPQYNSALTDGVVVVASTVTGTNKTLVHEMGHVFNLFHTFHDGGDETTCPSSTSCATTGDNVCDTEPMLNVPCSTTLNTCTGAVFQTADASLNYTVKNNYMSYTNCQWMFTQGQKDRIRAALFAFRPGLITSSALLAPEASPASVCSVSAANGLSPYFGVSRFTLNTLDVYSNSSQADGSFYVDRTCNQRTTLTTGQSYSLLIQGAFDNYHYLKAYLDYNADGDFNDAGETLLTTVGGSVTATVTVPVNSSVVLNTALRLRIVADSPQGAAPTACSLSGDATYGSGQVEDYTVVIVPRSVFSIASGNWTTPGTWSCTCVPGATDLVSIQALHTVSISSGSKQALSLTLLGKLQYSPGSQLQLMRSP